MSTRNEQPPSQLDRLQNPHTTPLGLYGNPYDLLRRPNEDRARKREELKKAGALTDEAEWQINDECALQSHRAKANHRECIRAVAVRITCPTSVLRRTLVPFRAQKKNLIPLDILASLVTAEIAANDYPVDLPFGPSDDELLRSIEHEHRRTTLLIKAAVKNRTLPVFRARGMVRTCNQDADVLTWCDTLDLSLPPAGLCTATADAIAVFKALALEPTFPIFGSEEEWSVTPANVEQVQALRDLAAAAELTELAATTEPKAPTVSPYADAVLSDYERMLKAGMGKTRAAEETGKLHKMTRSAVLNRQKRHKEKSQQSARSAKHQPSAMEQLRKLPAPPGS